MAINAKATQEFIPIKEVRDGIIVLKDGDLRAIVLAAWVQLGEQPSTFEIAGMLLIGLALIVISLHAMKAHDEIEPAMGQD